MPEVQQSMENDMVTTTDRGTGRLRRAGAIAVLLMSIALVAGACASGGKSSKTVARVGPATGSAAAKATASADPLAFAKCMRENGEPDFKDPQRGRPMGDGLDTNSAAFKKAMDACKALMPTGTVRGAGDPNQGWSTSDKLKYAQCMRDNGVPNFPDPDANGGFALVQGNGIDPNAPQFKKAEDACKKYQPESLRNMTPNKPGSGGGQS
jgi:hypothetical protein